MKKITMAGAACVFSTMAMAQEIDNGPVPYRSDLIAKIDTLTILQLSDSTAPVPAHVNLVNIFCPYNDVSKQFVEDGGVATLEHGTADELEDALYEYTQKMQFYGLGHEGVKGFAMSIIDTHGKIQPSYTFNQASKQAEQFHTDADIAGTSAQNPDLIKQINQAYIDLCFGNS